MKRTAAIALGLAVCAGAAHAQPVDNDIALRDIFTILAEKTSRTSDQAFFENDVLQGKGKRGPHPYDNSAGAYSYTYGPSEQAKNSNYTEQPGEGGVDVHFYAISVAEPAISCLTFSQAETELRRQGWRHKPEAVPNSGDMIEADYERGGVAFVLSNVVNLMPIIEPWNPPEVAEQQFAEMNVYRQERLKIVPGTEAYAKLCVTSVGVNFKR